MDNLAISMPQHTITLQVPAKDPRPNLRVLQATMLANERSNAVTQSKLPKHPTSTPV